MLTHAVLRLMAESRLIDAEVLFDAKRYDAAAYMCGYVLELALKACICRRLEIEDFDDVGELRKSFRTHDLDTLAILAGLREKLNVTRNPVVAANWQLVKEWDPEWRYDSPGKHDRSNTAAMLKALRDPGVGVLPRLKKRC